MRREFLSTRYKNVLHTYQALPAWSADASKLLYAGYDDTSRCDLVVRDLKTGVETAIAQTARFDQHCAAWQHWALGDTAVLFRGQDPLDPSPPLLARLDAPGKPEPIDALENSLVRQVIDRGRAAVYYNWPTPGSPARTGVFDLESRRPRVSLGVEEAIDAIRLGTRPEPRNTGFQHVVANPDGTRLFFKLDERDAAGRVLRERSFHAFDTRTRRFTDFGSDILGHPAWIDDRYIANIQKTRDGSDDRWLVAMDAETGAVHRLHDLPISGAGHPAVSPDGRWLVTDSFSADGKSSRIYLFDLQTGRVREIDVLDHATVLQTAYDPHVITRAHPHPTWSPDSRCVLANCNHAGDHLGLVIWRLFADE